MKHLIVIVLLIALIFVPSAVHAQVDCTPPADAQLVATNVTGQWVAWALGNSVTWCGQGRIVSTYEATYIDTLYFDGPWLPFNLYFGYSVDGYLFQMNVSTGQGHLISQHGQPPGDPGEAHGENAVPPPAPIETEAVVPTEAPTETPITQTRLAGLTIYQWVGQHAGW